MNWKEYISQIALKDKRSIYSFNQPANGEIEDLKYQLKLLELPEELEDLYEQTNGINEVIKTNATSEEIKIGELIWTIERAIETNIEYRENSSFKELYMSFDQFFFFSDAGNGDLFGFITLNGLFDRNDIFVWNHENDSRTWISPNLTAFIKNWTNGTLII